MERAQQELLFLSLRSIHLNRRVGRRLTSAHIGGCTGFLEMITEEEKEQLVQSLIDSPYSVKDLAWWIVNLSCRIEGGFEELKEELNR